MQKQSNDAKTFIWIGGLVIGTPSPISFKENMRLMDFFMGLPAGIVILGAVTLVEISPIKIDPWSKLFGWIGRLMFGKMTDQINTIQKDLADFKLEQMRWSILDFASAVRNGRQYDKEAWDHTIGQIELYERYIKEHKIPNGVMTANAAYLHSVYSEHLKNNDFL